MTPSTPKGAWINAASKTVINAMRPYDAGTPTLADFEWYLQRATEGATYTCTGLWQEVLDALDDVATAAPDVPKALLDAAMDAYLAQVTGRARRSTRWSGSGCPAAR